MEKLGWLLLFILGYWAYCIFWGWKGARQTRTASDYFIAGRSIGLWVFVLAATGHLLQRLDLRRPSRHDLRRRTSLRLRLFLRDNDSAHRRDFSQAPVASRQTLRVHHPGEMFSDYYRTDWMRVLTVVVAMVFSVPYLGIQLRASGILFKRLVEGTALEATVIGNIEGGAILLSIVVFLYVASGGLRSGRLRRLRPMHPPRPRHRHPRLRRPRSRRRLGELSARPRRSRRPEPRHGRHSDAAGIRFLSSNGPAPCSGTVPAVPGPG